DATLDEPRLKLITGVMITSIDLANSPNPPTADAMTAALVPMVERARIQYNNMSKEDQDTWVASYVAATHNFPGLSAVGKEGGGVVPQGMECLAELYHAYETSKAPIQLTPELKKTVRAVKCVMVSLLSGKALKAKKQRSPKVSHVTRPTHMWNDDTTRTVGPLHALAHRISRMPGKPNRVAILVLILLLQLHYCCDSTRIPQGGGETDRYSDRHSAGRDEKTLGQTATYNIITWYMNAGGATRTTAKIGSPAVCNAVVTGRALTAAPTTTPTSTALTNSRRTVDGRLHSLGLPALSGFEGSQAVTIALIGQVTATYADNNYVQVPYLYHDGKGGAQIRDWVMQHAEVPDCVVTVENKAQFRVGQPGRGYKCQVREYSFDLPPELVHKVQQAHEYNPVIVDIATGNQGVVEGRMRCVVLEENPAHSKYNTKARVQIRLGDESDGLDLQLSQGGQRGVPGPAVKRVLSVSAAGAAMAAFGAPPFSEAELAQYQANSANHPIRKLLLALSANAVTHESGDAPDTYAIHSSTPALRELLDQYGSISVEIEDVLSMHIKALQQQPLPTLCIAVSRRSGQPVTTQDMLTVMRELQQAHLQSDSVDVLVNEQSVAGAEWRSTLSQRPTRALSFASAQGDLITPREGLAQQYLDIVYKNPLSNRVELRTIGEDGAAAAAASAYTTHPTCPHPLLALASTQDMISALTAMQSTSGIIDVGPDQLLLGITKHWIGTSHEDYPAAMPTGCITTTPHATMQAHTEQTGGDAGTTIENNATRVDPLPHPAGEGHTSGTPTHWNTLSYKGTTTYHTRMAMPLHAGDNDPSGGANATQVGAAQRDLGGPSGTQRAGARTQISPTVEPWSLHPYPQTHSPTLTPGAERAARRQRQGGSGAGRGLNLSFTSKMDSISADDHNPGGSPMEEEQAEKTTEDTMTAVSRPATQAHNVPQCATCNHTDRTGQPTDSAWQTLLEAEGATATARHQDPTWKTSFTVDNFIPWLLLAAGDVEANPGPCSGERHQPQDTPNTPYLNPNPKFFEAQVHRNCQAHSLNNAAGKQWVKPEDLHNFWIAWATTLHDEDDKKAWHTARGDGGAFSDEVIHLYLRTKYGLTITRVAELRTTDDWNDDNFDTMAIEYATLNFLCKTNGHSMALRKLGGQWKLLDSESPSKSAIAIRALPRSHTNYFHEVFVIAPDPAATPAQTMATTRQGISHIISHKEDNQNPSQCYMERQYKQCCLVHAINMAIGKPMIRPEEVITHCKSLGTYIQGLAQQARQEHRIIPLNSNLPHIYEESGNFTISTINHYLYHHHKDLHLCPPTTTTPNNTITPELLITLTGKTDSYTNTAAILITHNHATTIRRINNTWHWLDSEQGRPCRLDTPEDWLQLKGTLVQIKKGDAANTNLIHPLCWLADPTRRATTEQLEQHLRTTHIDLTTQDLGTQPAHTPRTDRPPPTAQPASPKRILLATVDTHPTDKQARPLLRQVAPTVTLPTSRSSSSKRPTTSGTIVDRRRTKPRAQAKDPHTQTLMYRYLNTAPTPPPAANPTIPPPPTDNLPEHPGPHPQHSTLPSRQPQPTNKRQHITLTTLNVRSLHRSRNDVLNLVHQHSPDILILTETMTQPKSNNPGSGWLRRVMPDYTTHRHRGHSDVLIGIKHNVAIQMKTTMLPPSIDAEVNARCVILTLNQHQCEQLTIIATYWPSGNNGDALLLRGKMQEHIRTATDHLPGSLILAGDINATMKTEDRSEHTEYTQDNMMREFATEMRLSEADPGDRAWTYQQPHCNSRIDAILTRDARHGPEHRTHVDDNVYLSDHRPLTATLNTTRLGIDLAVPHKPPKHSHTILTTPITNKDREAYRLAVQQPSSGVPQLHAELTAFLAPMYTEATHHLATLDRTNPQQPQRLTSVAGRPAREAVDTAATMLTNLLQTCRTAAIKTCNTKTLTRGGQHYQRRTMCRIRLALGRKLKTARDLSRKANSLFKQTNVHPTIDDLIPETDATNEEIRDAVQARQGEDPTENHVQAALAQLANTYRDQIHQLDDEDSALAIAQARVRMQQLISTQPKKANKRILRPSRTDHKGLQALADPDTKTICTTPADLNRIITTAYGQK
ncbi:hypothetical protein QJQ45_015687, partial [Haematococcus lacustris]